MYAKDTNVGNLVRLYLIDIGDLYHQYIIPANYKSKTFIDGEILVKEGDFIILFAYNGISIPSSFGHTPSYLSGADPTLLKYFKLLEDNHYDYGHWLICDIYLEQIELADPAIAVNDYTCPTCKNTKCSKRERSCWRCGFPFNATARP